MAAGVASTHDPVLLVVPRPRSALPESGRNARATDENTVDQRWAGGSDAGWAGGAGRVRSPLASDACWASVSVRRAGQLL